MIIVRNVAIFSIVSLMVEELVPKDEYRKYLNVFRELAMILIMIQPVMKICGQEFNVDNLNQLIFSTQIKQEARIIEQYGDNYRQKLEETYEQEIASQISKFVIDNNLKFDHATVHFAHDDNLQYTIQDIYIFVSAYYEDDQAKIRKILEDENYDPLEPSIISLKNKVSEFYKLDVSHINVIK